MIGPARSGDQGRRSPGPAIAASPELRVTAQRLLESGYRRLPVVGTDGRLVGIVSRRDVLAAVYGRPPDPGPSSRR
jgi:CBS domain-containing protein